MREQKSKAQVYCMRCTECRWNLEHGDSRQGQKRYINVFHGCMYIILRGLSGNIVKN